jgi:hypothetical protein
VWSGGRSETTLSYSACSSTRFSPLARSKPVLPFLQTVSTPDEGTQGSWRCLILHCGEGFRGGETAWYLTRAGLIEIAEAKDVRVSDLPWVPDASYRGSQMLAHRLGVNAFFCALAEASRTNESHCLLTWRPEHWVRTKALKVDLAGRCVNSLAVLEALGKKAIGRGIWRHRGGVERAPDDPLSRRRTGGSPSRRG